MPEEQQVGNPAVMAWNTSMEVEHERMNREHKDFFTLFTRFAALAQDTRENQDELRDIITQFLSLASGHFVFEERLLSEYETPWEITKAHMDDHMRVQTAFLNMIGPVVRHTLKWDEEGQRFLELFVEHIVKHDKPLAHAIRWAEGKRDQESAE